MPHTSPCLRTAQRLPRCLNQQHGIDSRIFGRLQLYLNPVAVMKRSGGEHMTKSDPSAPWMWSAMRIIAVVGLNLVLTGCVLSPRGADEERQRLGAAGKVFEQPVEQRSVPDLPERPTWRDVLQRAFLTNGDLEAAYFDWKASMQRVQQAATWPDTNLTLQFSYMLSGEEMKAWDRTTVNVGWFDSMPRLPSKVAKAGELALSEAKAAGLRFSGLKFDLQRRVLAAYLDVALLQEKLRVQQDNVSLLKLLQDAAADQVRAGGNQQDMLRAQTEYRLAENELANMRAELRAMKAMLNGMLARPADASLELPGNLPEPRRVAVDDAALIAVAVDANPGLAVLAVQVRGRSDAVELARMEYLPDVAPMAGFTGSVSQMVGAMVMLPTTLPKIQGMVQEARAMLQSSRAMLRQAKLDRAAAFVAALYLMRNSERQADLFEQTILPLAEQTLASSREAYATNNGRFLDLIDAQRTLLTVRLTIAEVRVEREKRLAELEALAGTDIETLAAPTAAPASATRPSSRPSTRNSPVPSDDRS